MRRTVLNRIVAVLLALTVIVIGPRLFDHIAEIGAISQTGPDQEIAPQPDSTEFDFQTVPSSVAAIFPPEMARMLADEQHGELRKTLTDQAARYAILEDEKALARTLALLGESSVEADDLHLAEAYFLEALTMYQEQSNILGIAGVEMSLGLVNLDKRRRAIAAGNSYDQLLIARWKVSQGQYAEAESEIQSIIQTELSLDRYGAAANAYNTLFHLFRSSGDQFQAEQALSEAIRLYARVGDVNRAETLLDESSLSTSNPTLLSSLTFELEDSLSRFRIERNQLATADDLQNLYRHYIATGNRQRAWQLRRKAAELTRLLPTEGQIRRRSDSLAMLYSSNESVRRARNYLTDAGRIYDQSGDVELWQKSVDYLHQLD